MGASKSTLIHTHPRTFYEKSRRSSRKLMAQTLPLGGLTGLAKLKAVTELLSLLTSDLAKAHLLPQQRNKALEELKVYGRDPRNADPIFTKQGIETLAKHAFHSTSVETSRNALRCLANALLINPATRQIFVDLGYTSKACTKLRSGTVDDEFLLARIIFLTTYGTNVPLAVLIDQHHLADAVVQNLARHAKVLAKAAKTAKATTIDKSKSVDPMVDMALTETAKLLFNVTHFCPDRVDAFAGALAPVVALLLQHDIPEPKPLEPPLGSLVNALLILPLAADSATAILFPEPSPTVLVDRLVQLLDRALRRYSDAELDQSVLPLVTALRKLDERAPADRVRPALRAALLPSTADRAQVLGRGDSLAALLLRHTTNALAPEFRSAVAHLLFELSDKDASTFVQNVGYGFASGFLFQNNIPVPAAATEVADGSRAVNGITGQFVDAEADIPLPTMTEEEKEREAERLFVLFERLRRTGVVDVENPIATAMRTGKMAEIDENSRVEELD